MDLLKIFKKNEEMKCSICNNEITKKDINSNNCISVIIKSKNKRYAHKTCLVRR